MRLGIPDLSLVVLVGVTGSGKSSFARRHFLPTEILSSDFFRGLVADDENDQGATNAAFEALHFVAAKRLEAGRLTVVDATNVQPEARKPLIALARRHHALPVAIVLDLSEDVCLERNRSRPDRQFGPHVVRNQARQLRRSLRGLQREGFRRVHVLRSVPEVDEAEIEREPLWNNRKEEHGPFDIIGDVHGAGEELEALLSKLGYVVTERRDGLGLDGGPVYAHPEGRKAVFLGDLVDRGPRILDVLRIVHNMVGFNAGLCVIGNHEWKLLRKLRGRDVQVAHGLRETLAEIDALPDEVRRNFRADLQDFLDGLISHYVLDDGRLVVAHAGLREEMHGRGSAAVRDFAMYGETTGETDEFGLPVRLNWAAEYRGRAMVVYGHTPVPTPDWLNNTINVDTGAVFGGALTALRYPERELVEVRSAATYYEPARPFLPEGEQPQLTAQQRHDETLDLSDVVGKRLIETPLAGKVTNREENAAAALEVMSRFAIDPRWLVYLPPTMSPSETSSEPNLLEHPAQAFRYYRQNGVGEVILEEKHMGSRAVVVLARDGDAAQRRFGVSDVSGVCYTRTGRRFFDDADLESAFLGRLRTAAEAAGLWDELATDWMVLDAELMPWSLKAQELLRVQYAPVGTSAKAGLRAATSALADAPEAPETAELRSRTAARLEAAERYIDAYRRYCWPVRSADDLKLAPFHLLASEGKVHTDKAHGWHLGQFERLSRVDPMVVATPHRIVDLTDEAAIDEATAWWTALTSAGGEGMVVKPLSFVARGPRGVVQPAMKVRGPEYLRIIYGPEYLLEGNLERLRSRGLGRKRSLAVRELALGIEALERFVRREPLRRVHECVFAVLALESEPVDPRL